MISEFRFDVKEKSSSRLLEEFDYIENIPFFQKNPIIKFKPGINVLLGQNGCGKSTILKLLAAHLAALQGGKSFVTDTWRTEFREPCARYSVVHDGQPILYCDTTVDVGLVGGMSGFDDDFFEQGVAAVQRRMSSGWTRMDRMLPIVKALTYNEGFPKSITTNSRFDTSIPDFLKGEIPLGQRTILIDEPESALTFSAQRNIIDKSIKGAREYGYQLIFATHSPFILPYLGDEDVTCHNMSGSPTFELDAKFIFMDLGNTIQERLFAQFKAEKR